MSLDDAESRVIEKHYAEGGGGAEASGEKESCKSPGWFSSAPLSPFSAALRVIAFHAPASLEMLSSKPRQTRLMIRLVPP